MTTFDYAMTSVHFSEEEIELAQLFKAYGLEWTPQPGHFVLDQSQLMEVSSPFQDKVYFILALRHFLRRSGTMESLKDGMCWLPTWEQARHILREAGVNAGGLEQRLIDTRAIAAGTERLELYRMIEEQITGESLF